RGDRLIGALIEEEPTRSLPDSMSDVSSIYRLRSVLPGDGRNRAPLAEAPAHRPALLLRAELDLVVADAVAARHEHHGRRRHARDIGGIVAGARDDVARGKSRRLGGGTH